MGDEKKEQKKEHSNAEKSVSLAGAKFEEVVVALLKTEKPKKEEQGDEDHEK